MGSNASLVTSHTASEAEPSPVICAKPYEVSDLLVAYLDQLGIEYVFGIPGGAIEPLYNAFARSERRGGIL